MDVTETELRRELLLFAHRLWERRFLVALDGNLSVKLGEDRYLCTRAGTHKGWLTDADLLIVDSAGSLVSGEGQPTTEIKLHLACYEERPDISAVIHAHPPFAVACTLAGLTLDRPILAEVILGLGTIPIVPYQTTGTLALADALRPYARIRDGMVLARHGAVTLGSSLAEAFARLETVEQVAQILLLAGPAVTEIPWEEAVNLRKLGLRRYGGPPAAVAQVDAPDADLEPRRSPATPRR